MAYLYILKSLIKENWHYIGSCRDLEKRLKMHMSGNVVSTKSKRPLKPIYCEFYEDYTDARKRELFLKSPRGYKEKLKILKKV